MRRLFLTVLAALVCACGEAEEADPRCEGLTEEWSCWREYYAPRARCVDGQYQEDTCADEQWCLMVRPEASTADTPYSGTCVSKDWGRGGCEAGNPCPEGLYCWDNRCRKACQDTNVAEEKCVQQDHICSVPIGAPRPICIATSEQS